MSGGGGGGQQSQQTHSSNEPPAFIQPYLQKGVGALDALYNANPNAPAYYPGQTVAPLSSQTQGAVNMATTMAGNNPTLAAANTQLTDTLNGKYLDPSSNPAYQGAVHAAVDPLTTQFLDQTMPQITSQFAGSGRSGGSGLQQQYVDDATKAYGTGVGNAAYTAANNFYNNARTNQLQAAGLMPGVNTAGWQDVSGLGAAGSTVDNNAQANIDANVAKYNYNNNAQWDYINRYLASLNGGYPGGETNTTGFSTSYQPTNAFGSIMGSAMSGLGTLAMFAPMLSDERAKENITPVGKTNDGQNLYFYNYKGDSTPQIGLLAQEVEQTNPDAVVEHPSGFKMVDYPKALGLF